MAMKRALIAVLLIVLLISCEQLSFADTAYSTTAPKILFPSQPTAVLYGKNRMAYSYLSVNNEGTITGSQGVKVGEATVTVLGISRFHHAFVKIEYQEPGADTARQLWVEASYMRPYPKTKSIQVKNKDGLPMPNWPVRVVGGNGDILDTVYTNEQGMASYTGKYLNLADAFAFADRMWNNQTINSGTLIASNDCATFVSECLTAGGFCSYAPYVSSGGGGTNYYGSVFATLTETLGVPFTRKPSDGPIDVSIIAPGDILMMHPKSNASAPYGHAVLVHDVNPETQEVLTYSHTPYWHEWKRADDPDHAILCVIHTSRYAFHLEPVPKLILPETLTVPVGLPMELAVQAELAENTDQLSWTAEPESALQWENGVLTAAEAGEADITFTLNGASAVCHVTAIQPSRLPAGTVSLGEEALSGLPIAYLELPSALTEIADTALDGCDAVFIVPEGSFAEEFVRTKGLEYLIKPGDEPKAAE